MTDRHGPFNAVQIHNKHTPSHTYTKLYDKFQFSFQMVSLVKLQRMFACSVGRHANPFFSVFSPHTGLKSSQFLRVLKVSGVRTCSRVIVGILGRMG